MIFSLPGATGTAESHAARERPRALGVTDGDEREAASFELALLAALLAAPGPLRASPTPGIPDAGDAARRAPDAPVRPPEGAPGETGGRSAPPADTLFDSASGPDSPSERYEPGRAPSSPRGAERSDGEPATGATPDSGAEPAAPRGAEGASTAANPATPATAAARPVAGDAAVRAAVVAALRAAGSARPATVATAPRLDPEALADAWAARLQKLDAAAIRSGSTFLVPLDTGDGAGGQVHLAVRGRTLTATIVTGDVDTRRLLESSLGELRQALLGRGFDEAHLRIRTPRGADRDPLDRQADRQAGDRDRRNSRDSGGDAGSLRSPRAPQGDYLKGHAAP